MQSIHPEVKHFGDEDETIYETDEINKENMKEFGLSFADQKSENTKHTTKYDKQTLWKFCRKEERVEESKEYTFFPL